MNSSSRQKNLKSNHDSTIIQKVALTGASGFLGSFLMYDLASHFDLVLPLRRPLVLKRGFKRVRQILGNYSRDHLFHCFRQVDIVVHAAAVTDPNDSTLWSVNVALTRLVVDAARSARVQNIVYISSENVLYGCSDAYTQSKQMAEQMVLAAFPFALILRPSIIFGPGDTRYVHLFNQVIRYCPLIPVLPKYLSTIQPVHGADVAKCVSRGINRRISGIYTIVGTPPISFEEFGQMLASNQGKRRIFVEIPSFLITAFVNLISWLPPGPWKRIGSMLGNGLRLRSTNLHQIEKVFGFRCPSLMSRLMYLQKTQ